MAIVTGGSRGIGAATARLLAHRGYSVCVNYAKNQVTAESVVKEIAGDGGQAVAVQADVAVEDDVIRLFDSAERELGPMTALINNAGIVGRQSRLEDISADRIKRILAVNVAGCLLCSREAVRRMSTKNGGSGGAIVNVSSRASTLGSPSVYIDYAASKGAVDTMTLGLAKEVANERIRVNAVRPGFVHTDIHADISEPGRVDRLAPTVPMQRGGNPNEIAQAILWLLSDEASYTTGALLDVSGGA